MRKINFARTLRPYPRSRHASTASLNPFGRVTTLPNKLRVTTENRPGHFSSLGLYINTGARFETPSNQGVTGFVSRMAFESTRSMSGADMATAMSAVGGQIMCGVGRETTVYRSSHLHKATPLALSLISETVQNASFLPEELDAQRAAAKCEIQGIRASPNRLLPEVLHFYAYNRKGLGNPLYCHEDSMDSIDASLIRDFMTQWYQPERMVIAGSGMGHEELVELVERHFSSLKSTHITPVIESTYTGGYKFIHKPEFEFDHIYIAFEGVGRQDDDIFELSIMKALLGGGGLSSPCGPGTGLCSRLFSQILSSHEEINHCDSFHHVYKDSSLFGLFASFAPSARTTVLPLLTHQLGVLLHRAVPEEELIRAKNRLKSDIATRLESPTLRVEHLGLYMVHDNKVSPSELVAKIDSVTAESLQRVAERTFGKSGGPPTVLAMGSHDFVEREVSVAFSQYDVGAPYDI